MKPLKFLRRTSVLFAILSLLGLLAPHGTASAQETQTLPGQFAYVEDGTRLFLVRGNVNEPFLLVQASRGLNVENPRFSLDGRYLAYCMQDPAAEDLPRLYYVDTLTLEKFEITTEGSCSYDWWPGGKTLVFSTPVNPPDSLVQDQGIWSFTLDTGALEVLIRTELPVIDPRWSPDGRTLSYYDACFECVGKFYTYDLITKSIMEWAEGSSDWYPGPDVDWSPDGKRLAAYQALWMDTAEGETYGLVVASSDGQSWKEIHSIPGRAAYFPIWSPDGKRITFASFESFTIGNYVNRRGDLMTVAPDGSNARKLYSSFYEVFPQAWSPDGRYLLFVEPQSVAQDKLQKQQLVLLEVETGSPVWQISSLQTITADWAPIAAPESAGQDATAQPAAPMAGKAGMLFVSPDYALSFYEPVSGQVQKLTAPFPGEEFSVSPDGKTVLYGDQILSMHGQANGSVSASTIETTLPEQVIRLNWSPDGQKFGYVDEDSAVWVVDLQGNREQLAEGSSPPAWSYDGQWMAYCDKEGRLWIAQSGKPADWTLQQGDCAVRWSPTQSILAYIIYPAQGTEDRADGTAFLYDPVSGRTREIAQAMSSLDWSPDGKLVSISRVTSVGASNIAYSVTVVNPDTGVELFMDEYHLEMFENTSWIEQTNGYLFGRYRFQVDLATKEPVAEILLDAARDGSRLLTGSGGFEALQISCQDVATHTGYPLTSVTQNDTPGAAMPGLHAEFSPDGQWILISDYVEDQTVNWLARCDGSAPVQLPSNTWLFDQYFSPDSAWLVMENINSSTNQVANISLQELASGRIKEVQAGLNTQSAWFQMPEVPAATPTSVMEATTPARSLPTVPSGPLNLQSDTPVLNSIQLYLPLLLWAGALIALLALAYLLWKRMGAGGKQVKAAKGELPVEETIAVEPPPASQRWEEEVESAFQKGVELVKAGNAEGGIAELTKVITAEPGNEVAWFWLAIASVRQKDYRSAERCFLQAKKHGHPEADTALEWLRKQKN